MSTGKIEDLGQWTLSLYLPSDFLRVTEGVHQFSGLCGITDHIHLFDGLLHSLD